MENIDSEFSAKIKSKISEFLNERMQAKLEKLSSDDQIRSELQQQFNQSTWLEDAARRVSQIQAVTHSLKAIHPDARGSSLYCEPSTLYEHSLVGTHCLGQNFDIDVVGNAAALDVYKFLKLKVNDKSFLELCKNRDPDFSAALSVEPEQSLAWMAAFSSLADTRSKVSSHTNAKQIYWFTGSDPHDDSAYHLLAPLYPTSLIHEVYLQLQDDRFSEEAKAAREARKAHQMHERPVRDYVDMAIQSLGGTKPQNISQLNSERRGDNCLLGSFPPVWHSMQIRPLYGVESMFQRFARRKEVRKLIHELRSFLEKDPEKNIATRQRRKVYVHQLIEEFMQFAAEFQLLEPGWSNHAECRLVTAHRAWLDDGSEEIINAETSELVAKDFANWLNAQLRNQLPMGDDEYQEWCKLAHDEFKREEREAHV